MMKKDNLGDRMKGYEHCYRLFLPKNSYVAIRLDGVAFHTYTKGLKRPFDQNLMDDMDETTKFLCEKISGVKIGYVQSDEITLVLSDCDTIDTEPWYGNNLQKLCSVSSAMATAKFNQLRGVRELMDARDSGEGMIPSDFVHTKLAYFDARVFVLPTESEVYNMLQWRTNDASRNSVSSVAQSLYSHKELHGKSNSEQQELIFQKGINWNDYPYRSKRGGTFVRTGIKSVRRGDNESIRRFWQAVETPIKWYENKEQFPI